MVVAGGYGECPGHPDDPCAVLTSTEWLDPASRRWENCMVILLLHLHLHFQAWGHHFCEMFARVTDF